MSPQNPFSHSPKPRKLNIPGHAHELTFSCFKRMRLLKSGLACDFLSDSINAAQAVHGFEVWTYVFMPEHVHLMIYPINESYSISDILKSIKQPVARKFINYCRERKPQVLPRLETGLRSPRYRFWQDGTGYDRNYWSREEMLRQIEYIHNNPVKEGLVANPAEWKWSSAAFWMEDGESPVKIKREHFPR